MQATSIELGTHIASDIVADVAGQSNNDSDSNTAGDEGKKKALLVIEEDLSQ